MAEKSPELGLPASSGETTPTGTEEMGGRRETAVETKANSHDIASVPDGGLVAWVQVLGSFMLFFNTWGIVNTFGGYQTFYETGELFQASSSDISWIGSVQIFLLLFVGAVTGPLYDAGHFRFLLLTGSFLIVFGHMMLSLCTEYWQALLAQGFVIGLGFGALFVPSVAIIATYFSTKLAFAVGIAATGSSIGGIVYPIAFRHLQAEIGFAWATRVLGFIALGTLVLPCTTMQLRVLPAAKRSLVDVSAFKDVPWVLMTVGCFVYFLGLFTPFFYLSYYSITKGYADDTLSFYLLPIMNAGSTLGRVVPNALAIKTGPLNIMVPFTFFVAILTLCLPATASYAGVAVIGALYGFFSGTFNSLLPTIYVHLTKNRALIGTRIGMGLTGSSIGNLVGPPIAGAILGSGNHFTAVWIYSGIMALGGAFIFTACRVSRAGWKINVKV